MEVKKLIPIIVGGVLLVLLLFTAATGLITVIKVFNLAKDHDETTTTRTTSSPSSTTTLSPPSNGTVHIKDPEVIDKSSPRYRMFLDYAYRLNSTMNFNRDPCTDFYEYVCDHVNGSATSDIQMKNYATVLFAMNVKKPTLKIEKYLHQLRDKCVADQKNPKPSDTNGDKFLPRYNAFKDLTGLDFPALKPQNSLVKPTPQGLAKIAVHLANLGASGLIKTNILPLYYKTDGPAYSVSFGVAGSMFSEPEFQIPLYSLRHEWENLRPTLQNILFGAAKKVSKVVGVEVPNDRLIKDVEDVLKLEKYLADNIFNDPTEPEDYIRDCQNMTSTTATQQIGFIDYTTFLEEYVKDESSKIKKVVLDRNYKILLLKSDRLKKLESYLKSSEVDARTIYNYLFFRLALHFNGRLSSVNVENNTKFKDNGVLEKFKKKSMIMKDEAADTKCSSNFVQNTLTSFPLVYDKWLVEMNLPTPEQRHKKVSFVEEITENIINGFKAQVAQLPWTHTAKEKAYLKIEKIQRNIDFSKLIFNDTWLEDQYKDVKLNESLTYDDEIEALGLESPKQGKQALITSERPRDSFISTVVNANAEYMQFWNSINIYEGILQPPIFHVDYPLSVVYGAIGSVIGHEIVHGFDTSGVNFDEYGYLSPWLDEESKKQFSSMTKCMVEEFDRFNTSIGTPVNGTATVGENIADSGGIRASFNAYKFHSNNVGEDPRLPLEKFSKFTNDQLFFIGFSRMWCTNAKDTPAAIYSDVHSPNPQRVLGTLQNTPAFKSAFNCRAGDRYAPKQHCNVYTAAKPCP